MKEITTEQELAHVLDRKLAILFKHSTQCGISTAARAELERFVSVHPDAPVFCLNVTRFRGLAEVVEKRLGVEHASPQVIIILGGMAVWDASHYDITAAAIGEALIG